MRITGQALVLDAADIAAESASWDGLMCWGSAGPVADLVSSTSRSALGAGAT